jgi:hypothetical protein
MTDWSAYLHGRLVSGLSEDHLLRMLASGELPANALVRAPGSSGFVPAQSIPALQAAIADGQSGAATAPTPLPPAGPDGAAPPPSAAPGTKHLFSVLVGGLVVVGLVAGGWWFLWARPTGEATLQYWRLAVAKARAYTPPQEGFQPPQAVYESFIRTRDAILAQSNRHVDGRLLDYWAIALQSEERHLNDYAKAYHTPEDKRIDTLETNLRHALVADQQALKPLKDALWDDYKITLEYEN